MYMKKRYIRGDASRDCCRKCYKNSLQMQIHLINVIEMRDGFMYSLKDSYATKVNRNITPEQFIWGDYKRDVKQREARRAARGRR